LLKSFPSVLVPLFDPMATADINPGAVGIRGKLHRFLTGKLNPGFRFAEEILN